MASDHFQIIKMPRKVALLCASMSLVAEINTCAWDLIVLFFFFLNTLVYMVFSSTLKKGEVRVGDYEHTRIKPSNLSQKFQSQKHLSRALILSCLNCKGF